MVDGLASQHHVVIFDNRGVDGSGGVTPNSVGEMTDDAATFIDTFGFTKVNLLGFSLDGCVAQALVLQRPELVERLILAGTAPQAVAQT
ncbi:alpha/beta fold hydrolase [Caviibacterium pharyngocola]|uniref:AB hydrolase-1 domain-containing protein n=1 Tax=Caviibacterium pharyngocola TaxID=28159 RepID=A0A2M8RTR5_9PAST|nr:alpha/beta hydrolase [Caviibacterium pharyngocola]PJG82272.1 hypothetical protein CVP04_09925 [Caviibacterium pharyngocola]